MLDTGKMVLQYGGVTLFWILFLLGSYHRVFKYIYDLYWRPENISNKSLLKPYYRGYFVFHLLTAWLCILVLMPYYLFHQQFHLFNIINLFIWVSSLLVVFIGLNKTKQTYGAYIGNFIIFRNIAEIAMTIYFTFIHASFMGYFFLLYCIWYYRINDTYPRLLLVNYPRFNLCSLILLYAFNIAVPLLTGDLFFKIPLSVLTLGNY